MVIKIGLIYFFYHYWMACDIYGIDEDDADCTCRLFASDALV